MQYLGSDQHQNGSSNVYVSDQNGKGAESKPYPGFKPAIVKLINYIFQLGDPLCWLLSSIMLAPNYMGVKTG